MFSLADATKVRFNSSWFILHRFSRAAAQALLMTQLFHNRSAMMTCALCLFCPFRLSWCSQISEFFVNTGAVLKGLFFVVWQFMYCMQQNKMFLVFLRYPWKSADWLLLLLCEEFRLFFAGKFKRIKLFSTLTQKNMLLMYNDEWAILYCNVSASCKANGSIFKL